MAKKIQGKTAEEYIQWLESTLIPDLKESGQIHTAKDLETCIKWINHFKNGEHLKVAKPKKKSRAERMSDAVAKIQEGRSEIETLKEEITEWKDNMEEKLSHTQKYSDLEECESTLEDVVSELESACDNAEGIEFPKAFG